jgi:hypothetical protein
VDSHKRHDLLLDDTADQIAELFEVEHVFPQVFHKEVKRGWWTRVKAFFGFGPRAVSAVPDQPREAAGSSS